MSSSKFTYYEAMYPMINTSNAFYHVEEKSTHTHTHLNIRNIKREARETATSMFTSDQFGLQWSA